MSEEIYVRLSTLQDRMEEVLRISGMSARELSLKAGLAPGHVGAIIRTLGDGVTLPTIEKIARAAGVNAAWLATGAGSPGDHEHERQEVQALQQASDHDVRAERAATVAFIRGLAAGSPCKDELLAVARRIAAGEHMGEGS